LSGDSKLVVLILLFITKSKKHSNDSLIVVSGRPMNGSPAILVGCQQSLAIHFVSVAVDGAYLVLANAGSKDPVALKDQLDDFVVAIFGGDGDHATNSRQSLLTTPDRRVESHSSRLMKDLTTWN
jgi:hypothetical protein